jgi:hypothetical protein
MKARKWLLNGLMVAIFVSCFVLGTAHALPGVFPDLSDWVDTWFKVSVTGTVFHYSGVGVNPKPSYQVAQSMGRAYLHITSWNGTTHILTADIYEKDPDTGLFVVTPINIQYFGGTDLKFTGSAQLVTSGGVTMNLIFVFTGKQNLAGNFILGGISNVSTIASNILEIDDVGPERWVGSAKVSGPMVPASSLPVIPVCTTGVDPHFSSEWVVCSSDKTQAWVGTFIGQYHPVEICKSLGYSSFSQFGGTCGNVCGYCESATSCETPGNATFDGSGACGTDANGQILCYAVQWLCER